MTQIHTNVAWPERLVSILGGAYLLIDAISGKKSTAAQTMAGGYLLLRGVTGFCLAYQGLGKTELHDRTPNVNIRTSLTVNRPRDQVYGFWRRLENLPQFMRHLKSVRVLDESTSEWTASLTGESETLSWKSEIVKDDPGAVLSWRSLPGSAIENAGKVKFTDAPRSGTELHVVISYHAPLGIIGEKAATLLNPLFKNMVKEDVQNFKLYIEGGEALSETNDRSDQKTS